MTTRSTIRLGALDFSDISRGASPDVVIRDGIADATILESLGYSRLWFGEHHETSVAHASPAILVALAAAATTRIRIGSGGVLLNLYEPLRVANDFALLELLFPHRIDLGIARGTPSGERRTHLVPGGGDAALTFASYAAKFESLVSIINQGEPVPSMPACDRGPEIWALGSSLESAMLAGRLGVSYCHAFFLNTSMVRLQRARECYLRAVESQLPHEGWFAVAFAGTCAKREATARAHLASHANPFIHPTVFGTPRACADAMSALRLACDADEFLLLDISPTRAKRIASYELLARELIDQGFTTVTDLT